MAATAVQPKRSSNPAPVAMSRGRILFLAVVLLLWAGGIVFRLVNLQIVRYGFFVKRAAQQQQRTVEVAPKRGLIYDRNGRALAMTVSVDSVFAIPKEIPDQANTASLIAKILRADPKDVLARMQGSRNFVWLARKLDEESASRIRALNLKGIYFQKESKRTYPKRELAAQVLGYVGMDDEGLGGIERSFEERLRGRAGKMLVSVDARQRSLGRAEKQPEQGDSVVLTLDENIQYIAEQELERALRETRAEAATVVVQNPRTGEILALASRPTFDPNAFRNNNMQALKNRAVSDIYEPGSTFKIITVAAALEENLTSPAEVIDCQMGSITIFGHKINDHKPFGMLTVSQVLQQSSDVGAIKLGLRLGDQRFDQYIRAFGFGAHTGLELPGETRGLAKPASRWTKSSIGAISMGQEVGVSSVQLVSMVSAIANDGIYTPPRIVAGTIEAKRTPQTIVFTPAQQRRVVSPLTAVQMKKMLEDTVLFGTGKKAILDGYTSAGKTGTAQKINPATGTYDRVKHIASFAGFAPVHRPAVTITVMVDSPVGLYHGGDVAAPIFGRVAQKVLAYMNVPHDADFKNPQRLLIRASAKESDMSEGSPDRFSHELDTEAFQAVLKERATPAQDVPAAQVAAAEMQRVQLKQAAYSAGFTPVQRVTKNEPLPLPVNPEKIVPVPTGTIILDEGSGPLAPEFSGKSIRSALQVAQRAGVEIEVIGSGVAVAQTPSPGERVPPGTRVAVRFAR